MLVVVQVTQTGGLQSRRAEIVRLLAHDTVWRAIDDPDLRVVDFDNCSMVFNPITWDTHYVSPLIGAVLGLLRESASPAVGLASELAANPDDEAAMLDPILSALSQLAEFGLVTSDIPSANS